MKFGSIYGKGSKIKLLLVAPKYRNISKDFSCNLEKVIKKYLHYFEI